MSWLVGGVEGVHATATTTAPTWSAVSSDTADLLDLLAEGERSALPITADEWDWFRHILREAADETGRIDQNVTRPLLRDKVRPSRVGPFFRRARREGLIRLAGYTTSDDATGRNTGKPTPAYVWLGT